jgi:tetratricopeptide (TPR) repeat protein
MRGIAVGLAACLCVAALRAEEPGNRERLRQAAKLPSLEVAVNIGFDSRHRFKLLDDGPPGPEAIAVLRKALKGDASDAERYLQLARLYDDSRESDRAGEAARKAAELFRQRLKDRPQDGALLVGLGQALDEVDEDKEEEEVLRRAVKAAPGEARPWLALGSLLENRAVTVLFNDGKGGADLSLLLAMVLKAKPPEAKIAQGEKLLDEARDCFDRAVKAAPRDAECYTHRGVSRVFQGMLRSAFRVVRGGQENPLADGMFCPEALDDLKTAAELGPADYRALGVAALWDTLSVKLGASLQPEKAEAWQRRAEKNRDYLRGATDRLRPLAQEKDVGVAAGAAHVLATLEAFANNDVEAALKNVRRSVELQPTREPAWELLIGLLAKKGDPAELVAACRERLKHTDSPHNRVVLAKAYEQANRLDDAEREIRTALKQAPDDFLANLSLAALLLRRAADRDSLAQASKLLDKAEGLLEASQKEKRPSLLSGAAAPRLDLDATRGIHAALTGNSQEARDLFQKVLKEDDNHKVAKPALEALSR